MDSVAGLLGDQHSDNVGIVDPGLDNDGPDDVLHDDGIAANSCGVAMSAPYECPRMRLVP